jgi:hypothetical protein
MLKMTMGEWWRLAAAIHGVDTSRKVGAAIVASKKIGAGAVAQGSSTETRKSRPRIRLSAQCAYMPAYSAGQLCSTWNCVF